LELIEAVKGKQGVNGIHLMAVGWEEIVPRIVTEADLLPKDFVPADRPGQEKVRI
jgi:methylenetetrahydrofolate reductase (NADPH)